MNELETLGLLVGLGVIVIEAFVLYSMRTHVRKLEQLAGKLDGHITHMDQHIGMMDDRVQKIKGDIALVCKQVGVKEAK